MAEIWRTMPALISNIFDCYAGQPILVIGGGPSVAEDLPRLVADGFDPACVIGANDHAPKQSYYKTGLLVNCDRVHMEKKLDMRDVLRPYGLPIINKHSWADYRLAKWTFTGNSGLTAVAVAVALGGNPVVVTGIDMWADGRTYFHLQPAGVQRRKLFGAENRLGIRQRGLKQLQPLLTFARGANIRPVQGPLTELFKPYTFGEENFLPAVACAYRKAHRNEKVHIMRCTRPYKFGIRDNVNPGTEVAFCYDEARQAYVQSHFTLARVE